MTNRKLLALCLILILILILCGCQENTPPATEPATEPITVATEPDTEPTEPVWAGYSGPKDAYIYYYSEGRDREWEEDVLYFVNSHFTDNQLLRNRMFLVNLPGLQTDSRNFYNESIHSALLQAVNALIPEIENLTDDEMYYRIQMMSALFRDAHTRSYGGNEAIFPILFLSVPEDDGFAYYAVVVPKENEDLLYTELTAINQIPLEEVVERMRGYACYENEYGFARSLGYGGYDYDFLSMACALEATGICPVGEDQVTYTLMDSDGTSHDLTVETYISFPFSRCTGITPADALPVPYWYGVAENYWYTTDLAEETLYVRISSFEVEAQETYMDLARALTVESNNTDHFHKIIVDLRGNGGGYQAEGWRAIITTLAAMEFDQFYVLVDGGSYSCSMLFASEVKFHIPETIFAGTPTGEAPGFFAAIYDSDYIMPNCRWEFTVPTQYYQTFEANEENALVPEILIWQTLEDYIACRDVVLEYVLAQ